MVLPVPRRDGRGVDQRLAEDGIERNQLSVYIYIYREREIEIHIDREREIDR